MMIDVDATRVGNSVRYGMVWRKNKDRRGWAEHRDMTSDQYSARWNEYKTKGYRPLDVEVYKVGSNMRYAGIWVQNKEKLGWASFRNDTSKSYGERFKKQRAAGRRLVDIEIYNTPSGFRIASIWYDNKSNAGWAALRGMTRNKYQAEVTARSKNGYRVVDFESYKTNNGQRYAAIWEKKPGYAWQVRTNLSATQFGNRWRQYLDEGYRLVDYEAYDTSNGIRYGGVWAENDARFRYARKSNLDTIVKNYRTANNLPSISVVAIRNGNVIYRRGFGNADVANNKTAHAETVYNTASVAKVIGGTLAAKLEDEGRLRNGSTFSLDLTDPISTYLTGLKNANGNGTVNVPSTHAALTSDQLLSHLSCVVHYNTTPSVANQTTHYSNNIAAVQSIWNTGLATQTRNGNPCTVGTTWSYSTHAYTFVGAVLEKVTGRTVNQLLRDELFKPYGLNSMRVQYASTRLPSNSLRAVPYTNSNVKTSYSDNSWKVLSGGIESSTLDLARFGWKVLNGEILSADARDNRLWTRVRSNRTHGLGWSIINDPSSRRIAEWNGSWTGARANLRAYRDNGLVIAIMSNRTNHTVTDVPGLSTAIGNEILR
jgi:CubicO group peptidase (beta-lactamase class C family)